jgi:hypothetical protein
MAVKDSDPDVAQYCPVGPAQGTGEVFSDDAKNAIHRMLPNFEAKL